MNKATLQTIIEARIFNLDGNSFQDLCDRLCLKLYPDDYTPVRAGGPKGDTKMDGYCPKAKIYFAAHATRGERTKNIKKKIESDLEGCLRQHKDAKKWIFLTNDTLLGDIETFVQHLRTEHPKVNIATWGHKKLTGKILKFREGDIGSIIGLDLGPMVQLESEINDAARLLKEGKPNDALVIFLRLWEQHNSFMSAHQKFRTKANIGHAYAALGNLETAAHYFLQAKKNDPKHETARAVEALAYFYLGNLKKARELSKKLLKDFPEETIARAILIRSTSKETDFNNVEQMVPDYQLSNTDIAMALGEVAMYKGHFDIADKYMSNALKETPKSPQIKERLGELLLQSARIAEQAINDRGPTKEEAKSLEQARGLFTDALEGYKKQSITPSMVRTCLARATVYMGLNDSAAMERDISFAYQLDSSNPEAVFRYASMMIKAEDFDAAILTMEKLLGRGLRCSVELFLSQCLDRRNFNGDRKRAIDLLQNRLKDLNQEEPELRAEYLATLLDLERQTQGVETAVKTIEDLPEGIISSELSMALKGEIFRLSGNKTEAGKAAKESLSKIRPETSIQDKRRIATLLQVLGMYKEALELWKVIVQPEYIGKDTYRIMECAHQCEDVSFITEFAEKIRANGLWERKLFDLELYYREKYNDDTGARKVMEEFLAKPPDKEYTQYVRLRLSLLGIRTETQDLIEKDSTKLPQVKEVNPQNGKLVALVLRYGPEPIKGVEYAYELVRVNWDQKEAHMAMIESILTPVGPEVYIKHPEEIIAPGIAVQYQEDDTRELHWHIIENSAVNKPESSRNEFPISHPVSKEMLGKKRGERFYLIKDGIQERTATIKNVFSKYIYRFNDCLEEFENRFPGAHEIKRVIIKEEGEKIDLSPLDRLVDKDAKYVEKIEELYIKQLIPIYTVANLKGRRVIEAIQHIISTPNLRLKCCTGTNEELVIAKCALQESENIVIDATALGTIFLMKVYKTLLKIPRRLIVSQGTIDELRQLLRTYDHPENLAGSYTKAGFIPWSPENIEEIRKDLNEFIDHIEKYCIIESGLIVGGLEVSRRNQFVQIFGQLGLESIMLAARSGHILWTDDLATAEIGRLEFGCKRIWTQEMVGYFYGEDELQADFSDEVTLNLLHMRYYYTRPHARSLLKAVDKTHGDVDKGPLSQALDWFGDANIKLEGVDRIGAIFIKGLWQGVHLESINQTVTIRILERLSTRPHGMNVIHSWLRNIYNIFWIDVANAIKVKDVIEGWLKGGGEKRIIRP